MKKKKITLKIKLLLQVIFRYAKFVNHDLYGEMAFFFVNMQEMYV
jgi:hypothetical protein